MKLFINDNAVEYSLSEEKTLYDIIISLIRELEKSHAQIISITCNNKLIENNEDSWKAITIDKIENLHIEADSHVVAHVKRLQNIQEYLEVIRNAYNNNTYPQGLEIQDLELILQSIDSLCWGSNSTYSPYKQLLLEIFTGTGLLFRDATHLDKYENTNLVLTHIISVISLRNIFLSNFEANWKSTNPIIKDFIPTISQISDLIHNSYEKIANNLLVGYMNIIVQWIEVLHTIPIESIEASKQSQWFELHKESTIKIVETFDELKAAIEVNDSIAICDITEYEVLPSIISYLEVLETF